MWREGGVKAAIWQVSGLTVALGGKRSRWSSWNCHLSIRTDAPVGMRGPERASAGKGGLAASLGRMTRGAGQH